MLYCQQLHNILTASTDGILKAAAAESLRAELIEVEERIVDEYNTKLSRQKSDKSYKSG